MWHVITVLQDYYKSLIDGNNWIEIAVKEQLPLFLLVNVMYGTYPLDDNVLTSLFFLKQKDIVYV